MKIKIYDRKNNKYIYEKTNTFLIFLYNTYIGRCILKILSRPFFSKICSIYMNSKFSRPIIKKYIKKYNIKDCKYNKFKSFNDFFSRKIEGHNVYNNLNSLISIAQSRLIVHKIDDNLKMKIKETYYSLEELLNDNALAKEYKNGICLIFRLIPSDYHRYIYMDYGIEIEHKKIDGILHTVNPISYSKYKVYKQNTREYSILQTKNFGQVIQMEVGALLVGKIVNYYKKIFNKGEEKGYFQFGGSTVILIIKNNVIEIDKDIMEMSNKKIETLVDIGENIGYLKKDL